MSYDINILGIKTSGKHGVYEIEKSNKQRFLVDVIITLDDIQGDEIHNTINYENVVEDVIEIFLYADKPHNKNSHMKFKSFGFKSFTCFFTNFFKTFIVLKVSS